MNEQNLRERKNTPEGVEQIDPGTNNPVVDSDSLAYKGSVLAGLIQQTPMGRGVVAVGPMDEKIIQEDSLDKEQIASNILEADELVHEAASVTNVGSADALLNHAESEHLRTRWKEIQGKFVDEPRSAVQQADTLVSEVIDTITEMFANEHGALEGQWKDGKDVSTEDLRQALQHYRSFFNRLVV